MLLQCCGLAGLTAPLWAGAAEKPYLVEEAVSYNELDYVSVSGGWALRPDLPACLAAEFLGLQGPLQALVWPCSLSGTPRTGQAPQRWKPHPGCRSPGTLCSWAGGSRPADSDPGLHQPQEAIPSGHGGLNSDSVSKLLLVPRGGRGAASEVRLLLGQLPVLG